MRRIVRISMVAVLTVPLVLGGSAIAVAADLDLGSRDSVGLLDLDEVEVGGDDGLLGLGLLGDRDRRSEDRRDGDDGLLGLGLLGDGDGGLLGLGGDDRRDRDHRDDRGDRRDDDRDDRRDKDDCDCDDDSDINDEDFPFED